ncbi:MAG: cobalt ECF transporter T component CbiQ [Acidobacteriota bacterium]
MEAKLVEIPAAIPVLVLGAIIAAWAALLFLRGRPGDAASDEEKDWSIPSLDAHGHGPRSPFHRWDARIKLPSLLFYIFCVASVSRLLPALAAVALSMAAVLASRTPLGRSMKRLAAMGAFLSMFLIVMPLTVPTHDGDTLFYIGGLPFLTFNLRGLAAATLICLKASAIALMMEPLLATAPFSVTVQALAHLKLPHAACQMILLTHRYIFVFQDETHRMAKGMAARGFRKRTDLDTLRTVGNFLGMLLVRSFERTQRVHDAMLSRGYRGTLPLTFAFRAGAWDWAKGGFWIAAGLLTIVADRLWR